MRIEHTTIDNRRVKLQERKTNKNGEAIGLEAPYGYYEDLIAPWGAVERCYVVTVPGLSGEKQRYASVYKPATNPSVYWSVFEVFS